MKIIYIASPYTIGDNFLNVRESLLAADKLVELGYAVYAPLLSAFWNFLSPKDYDTWMKQCFAFIPVCDGILRIKGESSGADSEVSFAIGLGMPVFYSFEELDTFVW